MAGTSVLGGVPFRVAVAMLALGAFLTGPVASWLRIKADKLPLPLKAPLSQLDESRLYPYRVVARQVLEPEIVEALGTDQYLYWTLEDTSVEPTDPLRYANLFVTYDTGGRNLVPHRPDVCFLGAGYEPAQPHENIRIDVGRLPDGESRLPVRVCTFRKTALHDHSKVSVVYTFHANGRFVNDPYRVRMIVNAPTCTHAYFSKAEVSFPGATREQTVEGAKKLFRIVLPILLENHWPDFDAAERESEQR
ncbi:MAG: exosortase-associated EpsI family protein [Planctomycetota bacterium]|nr:MAG: exosortase-associated EpsI family protein [Planctomycetota bacterium]